MKRLTAHLATLICGITSLALISCGGGSGDGNNTNNQDTAPATLDKTALELSAGLKFNFNRISGDATSGTESGWIDPIDSSSLGHFSLTDQNGRVTNYDHPNAMSGLSYTYAKQSSNAGTIIITGDGAGDGEELDSIFDEFGFFIFNNDPDVFVNQAANGDAPFVFTVDITFGSTTNVISDVAIDGDILGTSSLTNPRVLFFSKSSRGLKFTMQDGSDVPTMYDLTDSSTAVRANDSSFIPTQVSTASPLTLEFDSGNENTFYYLNGIASDDQGMNASNLLDQGIFDLTQLTSGGTTYEFRGVPFGWYGDSLHPSNAALVLIVPVVGDAGTVVSHRTETYVFQFSTTESGRFYLESDHSVRGNFSIPFADQVAN